MKRLNSIQINQVSGGESDSNFVVGMIVTPDDITVSNFLSVSIFGGGIIGGVVGAYCGYQQQSLHPILGGVIASAGGIVAGSVLGGAASSFFLTVTQPVYNYVSNQFS